MKSPNNKTVLFIFPGTLLPVQEGAATRTWVMINHLRHVGFRVELVTLQHGKEYQNILTQKVDQLWIHNNSERKATIFSQFLRLKAVWQKLPLGNTARNLIRRMLLGLKYARARFVPGDSVYYVDYPPFSSLLRKRNPGLEEYAGEVAYQCSPLAAVATYAWSARALDRMPPGTLRILDTIDVQHLRANRAKIAGGDLSDRDCTRKEEIIELRRADMLLAIQSEEQSILKEMCPDKPVLCVEHALEVSEKVLTPETAMDLLFVGNLYDPNVLGVKQFLHYVWPRIREIFPRSRFLVCGRVCEVLPKRVKGVRYEGVVPDLLSYYQSTAIVVNPVPYGTGLKIKTVEALAYGKCLVTTKAGILGCWDIVNPPFVVTSMEEMGDKILDLLKHPEKRRHFENAAWQFAQKRFTPKNVFAELVSTLKKGVGERRKGVY